MGSGVSAHRKKEKNVVVREVEPAAVTRDEGRNRELNAPTEYIQDVIIPVDNPNGIDRSELETNYYPEESDENTDRYLSNCFSQETPHQNSIEPPFSERSDYSEGDADAAEMFAHTALSLGMDNDDLLFNLMYFGEGESSFGAVMNNVQSETLALHSENNTPYKLKPASTSAISGLSRLHFGVDIAATAEEKRSLDCDCAVCKDDIEHGTAVLQIPSCQHFFHEECLLRWINLQGWCPVCRAPVEAASVLATAGFIASGPISEEGPTTDWEPDNEEEEEDDTSRKLSLQASMSISSKSRSPVLRLFETDDGVIPVRNDRTSADSFQSQKYGSDVNKVPGPKQCVV